jgi:hypothetical protein
MIKCSGDVEIHIKREGYRLLFVGRMANECY